MVSVESERAPKRLRSNSTENDTTKKLPITLLCGFLGAGKTTLLQHILHTKHSGSDAFKCAVIVNDMAELNIDKSLIDESALVQSDEVISMQNGCICCDLQGDLMKQIIQLAKKGTFDYMIIEASGVSEPSEVASLFADCEDDHDHKEEHSDERLNDLAMLDTCVTVVDCNNFLNNFERIKHSKQEGETAKLLAEQIEYSNVTILNKTDLVSASQLDQIKQRVKILNPKTKVLTSSRDSPLEDIMDVVDTKLYNEEEFQFINKDEFVMEDAEEALKACCIVSQKNGEPLCCEDGGNKPTEHSEKSQIILPPAGKTRHEQRFGISSFLYQARLPFHPLRIHEQFLDKYFTIIEKDEEEDEDDDGKDCGNDETDANMEEGEGKKSMNDDDDDDEERIMDLQVESMAKQNIRMDAFGTLLRSKGFMWLPNTHDLKMTYSQAGSMVTMESSMTWTALDVKAYVGSPEEQKELRKNWKGTFGDRRQELVFIGIDLKHQKLQAILDECLMTPKEYALGVDGWKATLGDSFLND